MNYGVDPHTAVLVVAILLPGMFLMFVLVGTGIYLRRRMRFQRHQNLQRAQQGEQEPGDYEKWLENVTTPGASQAPSQNASLASLPSGKVNVRVQEVRKSQDKKSPARYKRGSTRLTTVDETVVG